MLLAYACVFIYVFFLPLEVKKVKVLVAQSCLTLCDSHTGACQAPLSMGFYRKEYWTGLPFPSPEDLPVPNIEPESPTPHADSLLTERHQESPPILYTNYNLFLWMVSNE